MDYLKIKNLKIKDNPGFLTTIKLDGLTNKITITDE